MKIKYTIVILLLSFSSFAQQSINYKAIIKDGGGNILANQSVDVQFIIYEGAALTNNVYQESHTTNTDANGIVIVNIGEGTTTDVFTDVTWRNDEHFLNVHVDTGAGLVDMGTTQFKSVPYAANVAIMPKPYILGRSAQTSNARFDFNGKYGWQAAQEMCEATFPGDPNVRAFTLEQIAQAMVLGNWDAGNLNNIRNVYFWAITPYAVGPNFNSYNSESQNSYGLNVNAGDISSGTRGQIRINDASIGPGFNNILTYLRASTNVSNGLIYPCMCGTYK